MRKSVIALALLPLIAACNAEKVSYHVPAGEPSTMSFILYTDGCVSIGQYRSKVIAPPAHGTFDFRQATIVPDKPPCAGKSFVGSRATYTPAKGFKGTDHMVLQLGTPRDTSSQRYVYREYDVTFVVD